MMTCMRCGARASRIGIRGALLWTRNHLGDATRSILENTAESHTDLSPACRKVRRGEDDGEALGAAHAWKWWRRSGQARS